MTLTPYDFATPVTEDIELYADWTADTEKFTVKWDGVYTGVSNLPATTFVVKTDNTQVNAPSETPMREGYEFAGWAADKNSTTAVTFPYAITGDTTFYALWTRNQVRITWPSGMSAGETFIHTYTEDATSHSTMVDVGSTVTFQVQWHKEYDPATVLANDLPLGGRVGTENEFGVIYTYQFTANENTTITVNPATRKTFTITLPSANGCDVTFTGCTSWNGRNISDSEGATSYTFQYGDTFKVKLDVFADTRATLRVDGTAELPNVDGNDDNPTQTTREFTVDHAYVVTVSARAVVTRMVTFSLEPYGSIYSIQYVENGSALTKPADPKIPGYNFGEKWTTKPNGGGREWDFANDKVTSNLVLYGQLTALKYTVKYNANAGSDKVDEMPDPAETKKTHGEPLTLSNSTPTRDGYTFKGWATSKDGPVAYMPGSQYLNDAEVELFAVWETITYTVTISSGAGYSTVPAGIGTVEWGNDFTFIVNVDRDYAAVEPKVYLDNSTTPMQADAGQTSDNSAASWKYIIPEVKANHSVRIEVTRNLIHKVAFYAVTGTTKETTPFLTQSVEHGYYASMPAAPEREGYKFKGYYSDEAHTTLFPFEAQILTDKNVYAYYEEIQPQITAVKVKDTGWALNNWKSGSTTMAPVTPAPTATTNNPFTIKYGDDVTFDLVIQPGYDYSKLSVSANGYELGRENIKTENGITTISFRLVYVTANTRITVSGIERKTITVTYNENALDHVSNLPAPQTANYYIKGDKNNTNFTDQAPVRNGYTFLGWALSGTATEPDYKIADIQKGLIKIPFDKDTTVYAIWAAKDQKVTLKIVDEFTTSGDKENPSTSPSADGVLEYAYEGDTIFLVGELEHAAQGTMTFYKKWRNATTWKQIGTAAVNGGQYGALEITAEPYRQDSASTPAASSNYRWDYKVVFTPANEEGYKTCESFDDLRVYSKAISWDITKPDEDPYDWVDAQRSLSIFTDADRKNPATTMTANNTYWLQIPKVIELDGGLNLKNDNYTYLTVGQHYEIIWEYQDSENHWTTYTTTTDTDWVKVTPEFSGYTFRAKVKPSANSIYTKAATYTDANALVRDVYWDYLITAPTNATVVEETKTTLTIDTTDELNSVVINDKTPFEALGQNGSHKAQFEGQTITLVAKVTKTDETTAVNMGTVEFYRQVTDENGTTSWVSIGTAKLEDEGTVTGEASIEFQMPAYATGKPPIQNKEVFKAVYVQNATYKTSTSANSEAYIKSAQLQIPVIADVDTPTAHTGKWINDQGQEVANDKTATSYENHLGGLTAGIKHTFQLKQTGANKTDEADWSVVARDGRTVADGMYTMKWETLTDANWKTTTTTGTTYTAETTKVGDRYHILLTGAKNSPFEGSEVVSKDIAIGEPQGVTVTVEAIDAIKATGVDRDNDKYPDVYQLNEITLTATVEAAEDGADRKPQGTVAFYYVDEDDNFQPLGEAELKPDTSGKMVAKLTTDELPVETLTKANTKLTSEITAVYYGDETFLPSDNWVETTDKDADGNPIWKVTDAAITDKVISDHVTVYSSVIFNCADENLPETHAGDMGIHIALKSGAFLAYEKATLELSDIYTLDRKLDNSEPDYLRDTVAKLTPGTDYTIQWQILRGATAIKDNTKFAESANWEDIAGATGVTVVLSSVEADAAYRAVITVKDPATAIVKGSFEQINQGDTTKQDANDGRKIYYSNVLMPKDGNTTISVAINTSKTDEYNSEGVTEGEIVTANVFLSGSTKETPNATVSVTVENDADKGNTTQYQQKLEDRNTVNGWNAFDWDTKGVQPGFYKLTVKATSNAGYADKIITRSIIVRESSYGFELVNGKDAETYETTYNGRTQGIELKLTGFTFNDESADSTYNAAAAKSWTVKYYDAAGKQVEPSQAGTYTATVTLPGSAYWTEQTRDFTFTIQPRKVYVEDAVAQAKVYDGKTNVNLVEVILNDAVTDQTTGLPTGNTGIINGDSIYATATGTLKNADAGENKFTVSDVQLHGDDADNYVVDGTKTYEEPIYVSRSQVYGETGTLKLKQGDTFPAADVIKMIDQSGKALEANKDYTLTFYYHSDTEIEKTEDLSKTGLYTVVARPNQDNYKGGVTMKFKVVKDAADVELTAAKAPKPSTLIDLTNTATVYNPMGNVGVTATSSQGNTVEVKYQNGTDWSTDVPANAGRYLVKATDTVSGDVAYGIYTITKAHPTLEVTPAENLTYNSMQQNGYTNLTGVEGKAANDYYLTYAGDVAIGFDVPTDGNVAEQAPVDAGSYVVTLHVNETTNYTAHEVSAPFVIKKRDLTIKGDSWTTTQYGAFPDMTATYTGLAAENGDDTPDTSLRDVQIAPEFLYNATDGKANYSNSTLDKVGTYPIQPIDALSKNYKIKYENGQFTNTRTESKPTLAIHGLPQNSTDEIKVYYGDVIQLYPYGYYTTHANGSSLLTWNVTNNGVATITENGVLTVTGVGTFTVKLTRGATEAGKDEQTISTEVTVRAIKKELGVHLLDQDKVYTGSNQDYSGTVTVYDELYKAVPVTPVKGNLGRTDIGTQLPSGQVPAAETYYQSLIYRGKYTINDKEATVEPQEDTHIYGEYRKTKGFVASDPEAISNVQTASQTDDYNRLDVHDGYEILVAGTENMNYNVKYKTDHNDPAKDAADSKVATYGGVKFTSKTRIELNDATVYGETPNVLDWTLEGAITSTRGGEPYADNLADFDLESIFVEQDKDDCIENSETYKAANRTTVPETDYNKAVLDVVRTATDTAKDENYTLKFKTVINSGAENYKLTNDETGNATGTTKALKDGSLGFVPAAGESGEESGENFIEGSANIAQRPVKVTKASTIGNVRLYWRLPQSKLYTALLNILEAEENSTNRGLAKGHTIKDLDLKIYVQDKLIDPNNDDARSDLIAGPAQVRIEVGDTNYVLDGNGKIDDVELKAIQIEATYTTKTATNFVVLIKIRNQDKSTTPLESAAGLSYEILRKVNGSFDGKTYASGKLTYTGRTAVDKFGDLCGVFTASYGPLSNIGGTYFIQMYEYGVALKTENS